MSNVTLPLRLSPSALCTSVYVPTSVFWLELMSAVPSVTVSAGASSSILMFRVTSFVRPVALFTTVTVTLSTNAVSLVSACTLCPVPV